MITSSISDGSMPERSMAALIASDPNLGAERVEREPMNAPIGVRAPVRITASCGMSLNVKQTTR
jgi:hypothetical protein